MVKITIASIIILFVILSAYGIGADLAYPRPGNEREQVKLALKFGRGDFNPHYFLHPPLFSYMLFVLYGIIFLAGRAMGAFGSIADYQRLYFIDPSLFYISARLLVLALAGSSVALFYSIGRRLFDKRVALMASFFLALTPLYVKLAHYAVPDIPLLFMTLASFYFAVRIFERGLFRDYAMCGILLGLAIAVKYNAALMIVPAVLAHRGKFFDRRLAAFFAFIVVGFFLGNPFAFLDSKTFVASFAEQARRMNAEDYNFASWRADKPGWIYIITDTMPFGLGVVPTCLVLAGIVYSLYRRTRADIMLLGLIFITYLAVARWSIIKPRYFIFAFPFALLLAARFIIEMIGRIRISPSARTAFACMTALIVAMEPFSVIVKFDKAIAEKPAYLKAKDWIEANIPKDSAVASMTGVYLVPNEKSIRRKLKAIEEKKLGEGVMLKTMLKYTGSIPKAYDLHELPYPWREDFDERSFNLKEDLRGGVRYFVFTQEAEEYASDPAKYKRQVEYIDAVKKGSSLLAEFRQGRPMIEPGYLSDEEYVEIYLSTCTGYKVEMQTVPNGDSLPMRSVPGTKRKTRQAHDRAGLPFGRGVR